MFVSWLNQASLTEAQNCSDCLLGAEQTQLNSPFGYDVDFASRFQSQTSSCTASGYAFTSPAPYILTSSATTTSAAAPTPSCQSPYTVKSLDSCNSVAQSNNVSTFSIINSNGLSPNCDDLAIGMTFCLASPCTLYNVQASDTCNSIIQALSNNVTATQFLAWNPNINSLCGNLWNLKYTFICVG